MNDIKAYYVSSRHDLEDDKVIIVYAANENEAITLGAPVIDVDLSRRDEYDDLYAFRLPCIDKYCNKTSPYVLHECYQTDHIYREAGFWECENNNNGCDDCGLYEYDSIPESRIIDCSEDDVNDYICVGCLNDRKVSQVSRCCE